MLRLSQNWTSVSPWLQARLGRGDYTAVAEGLLEYYDDLYDRHLGKKRVEKHVVVGPIQLRDARRIIPSSHCKPSVLKRGASIQRNTRRVIHDIIVETLILLSRCEYTAQRSSRHPPHQVVNPC